MLKVGLVGCGYAADLFHLSGWEKVQGAQVVVLCDKNSEKLNEFSKKYSIEKTCTNFSDFLKQDIDIVDLCTPNHLHFLQASEALEAGKHCLVEKPLAINSLEASKLAKLSKEKNRVLMCAQHQRFREESIKAKQLITSGALGKVYKYKSSVQLFRSAPAYGEGFLAKELGGGPLLDFGSHFLDLAMWFMDFKAPLSAYAVASNEMSKDAVVASENEYGSWSKFSSECAISGIVCFDGDVSFDFDYSYLTNIAKEKKYFDVFGTMGSLRWPTMECFSRQGREWKTTTIETSSKALASIEELQHFVDSIVSKKPVNVTPEQNIQVLQVLDALSRSVDSKESVKIVC